MTSARAFAARLENGSVMTRAEFHAVYLEFEELHGVELIEGVVFLPAPIPIVHASAQAMALQWLWTYAEEHSGAVAITPVTVLLDDLNELEPDAMLVRTTEGWLSEESFVAKAPELVFEIARDSGSRELHQKKDAYSRNGVREYIVWRTKDEALDWFVLHDGGYAKLEPDSSGRIESLEFPGLIMNVPAMLAFDRPTALAALKP